MIKTWTGEFGNWVSEDRTERLVEEPGWQNEWWTVQGERSHREKLSSLFFFFFSTAKWHTSVSVEDLLQLSYISSSVRVKKSGVTRRSDWVTARLVNNAGRMSATRGGDAGFCWEQQVPFITVTLKWGAAGCLVSTRRVCARGRRARAHVN